MGDNQQLLTITIRIELPWPEPALSPNARSHWRVSAKARKAYRGRCRVLGEAHALHTIKNASERVLIGLTFFPPDRRARDVDNMLASMKSGLDGLADAMGIDDSRWAFSLDRGEPVKGGLVVVEVRA